MKQKSWFEVMGALREATIEFGAAWADGYGSRNSPCRCSRESCLLCRSRARDDSRQDDDFLADFVRLHVDYLGQVARLNSTYSAVAARFLGGLVANMVDGPDEFEPTARADVELMGRAGDQASARLAIRNELEGMANLTFVGMQPETGEVVGHFVDENDASFVVPAPLFIYLEGGEPFSELIVNPGQRVRLLVTMKLATLPPGRRYRARLKTKCDGATEGFAVLVEVLP